MEDAEDVEGVEGVRLVAVEVAVLMVK